MKNFDNHAKSVTKQKEEEEKEEIQKLAK